MGLFIRLLICIFVAGFTLNIYIDKLNELTELRLSIPLLAKELKDIQEKNLELQYAIEQFESPSNLIEMAQSPEFGHLKFPLITEITFLSEEKEDDSSFR